MFCFISVVHDFEKVEMKRTQKSEVTSSKHTENKISPIVPEKIKREEDVDFRNISNADITMSSIINVSL